MAKDYIKHIINKINTFNNGRLSKKSIGEIIRAIHFTTPINIIGLMCISPQYICNLLIIYLVFISIFFIIFDGCFLTIVEQYYCEDTFTIIDPSLELMNIEKTNKNRYLISIPMAIIYLSILFIIYDYRFIAQSLK